MSSKVLGTELSLRRTFPGDDHCDAFTVGARIDLVLLRTDEHGDPYVELVDWKSGQGGWGNPLAPVISRFVATPLIHRHLPAGSDGKVIWTEFYVVERHPRRLQLTLLLCLQEWERVKALVSRIGAEEVFPPSPSPQICRFCEFNGHGCDAAMPGDDDVLW